MKIFSILLGILSAVLIVVVIVLVVLLVQSNKEVAALKASLSDADSGVVLETEDSSDEESEDTPSITTLSFTDVGLGIDIEYPSDWTWELDTEISDDFGSGAYKEIHTLDLNFSKGSNKIEFSAIFGGVGDMGIQYPESEYDTKVLNDELIRVKKNGESNWRYLSKIPCSDAVEWDGVTEVCGAGGFFPGFANGGASTASFTGSNSLLDEVDAIVLTAAE